MIFRHSSHVDVTLCKLNLQISVVAERSDRVSESKQGFIQLSYEVSVISIGTADRDVGRDRRVNLVLGC